MSTCSSSQSNRCLIEWSVHTISSTLLLAAGLRTTPGSIYPSVGGPVSRLAHRPSFLPPKRGAYIIGIHHITSTYITVSIFAILNTGFWHSVHRLSRCRHSVSLCFNVCLFIQYSVSTSPSVSPCLLPRSAPSVQYQSQGQVSVSSIPYGGCQSTLLRLVRLSSSSGGSALVPLHFVCASVHSCSGAVDVCR